MKVAMHLQPAQSPNCKFNVDANSGHAFGILLAAVGALRPCGAPAPVNSFVRLHIAIANIPLPNSALSQRVLTGLAHLG